MTIATNKTGPTAEKCTADSQVMTEEDLDQHKQKFNHLQVYLNAAQFPLSQTYDGWRRVHPTSAQAHKSKQTNGGRNRKVLPIWLRVCQVFQLFSPFGPCPCTQLQTHSHAHTHTHTHKTMCTHTKPRAHVHIAMHAFACMPCTGTSTRTRSKRNYRYTQAHQGLCKQGHAHTWYKATYTIITHLQFSVEVGSSQVRLGCGERRRLPFEGVEPVMHQLSHRKYLHADDGVWGITNECNAYRQTVYI